jgi:hypothetical protein
MLREIRNGDPYDSYDSFRLEDGVQILDKFQGEQIYWLCTTRENIMDDIIELLVRMSELGCIRYCIGDDCCVALG